MDAGSRNLIRTGTAYGKDNEFIVKPTAVFRIPRAFLIHRILG
jgi:hypothetical protein